MSHGVTYTGDLCDKIIVRCRNEFHASVDKFELHVKQKYWPPWSNFLEFILELMILPR
jgi:hypothetical protein